MVNELEETQWAYLLSPEFELINTAGKPLTGGWLEVYIHGTRTKYYCASDFTGTLHPFKIPLDSLGANIVLASPANAYDVYCYNKYGTLVMSRYNVLPQVAGTSIVSGGVVLDSSDGTITIEQTGDNVYDLSVSDIIDSVTASFDESITNIEGDIAGLVSGKKDIQVPYSASGSPTKTVTSVTQDANGVIKVTYSDIDLPQQVPNIEIESSTLDVVSSIDPETNTKTFTIDTRSVTGDASFAYGDPTDTSYIVSPHTSPVKLAGSSPTRMAGNDISYDGTDKQFTLKAGVYFVNFNVEASTNSVDDSTQQVYAEIASNGTVHDRGTVTVDRTVSGQKSEIDLSSIIFAPNDNYVIEVDMGADSDVAIYGRISHWDIFRIDRGGISGGSVPGHEYLAGWGIEINQDDEISVDPTILDQYVTEGELATAIDNVIDVVTGLIPEAQVQSDWDETDPLDPSYINNKPDLNDYVTDQELIEAISGVTGSFVQEQADWAEQDSTKVDYIKNKPVEKQLIPGDNIVITESATGVIISSTGGGGASGTVQNIVEYVDSTTTPNFFTDCVTLLEQGIEPAAMYNGNMYQLWHTVKNGNTYTSLGFICVHYHDFQYSNISYDHQFAYNAQLWADANGVYPGSDRMGYNYLAGDGINAVTGVVNGEHAITYSIDPMEVATAVSGLLPVGTGNNILDVSDYTAAELYTKIGEMLSVGMSPVIKSGRLYYNFIEVDPFNRYVFNYMFHNEAYDMVYHMFRSSANNTEEYGYYTNYEGGDYINIDGLQISVSPSITGLITDVASGMIPDVSNLVSDDELTAAVSGKSDKFVVLKYQDSYTWDYVKGLVDNNILVYCKYNNTMCVLTDVPSSSIGFFKFTGYKVNEHSASKLTDEVITLKFGRTMALMPPTWSMSTTKVAAEVLPGMGLIGAYNSTSDIYSISINPGQIAGAISGLLPTGPTYSAGNGIDITNDTISVDNTVALKTDIPDVSDFITSEELQDTAELVTGLIPDTSNLATKAELQDGLELVTGLIPTDYTTPAEVEQAIDTAVDTVTGLIPTDYVTSEQLQDTVELVTGLIPDTSDLATKAELQDGLELVTGIIPNYQSGTGIDINNETISIDNTVALKTDIPDVSDFITSEELQDGLELVTGLIPNYTAGDGIDITNDIISVDSAEVASAVSGLLPVVANTAGITDIQYVQALPADPVSSVLYLIPET